MAKEALDRIAAIYVIEANARFAPIAERLAHRAETAPLLEAFFTWVEAVLTRLSAKSELAEASATSSSAASLSRALSPTGGSKPTTTSPRTRCGPLR